MPPKPLSLDELDRVVGGTGGSSATAEDTLLGAMGGPPDAGDGGATETGEEAPPDLPEAGQGDGAGSTSWHPGEHGFPWWSGGVGVFDGAPTGNGPTAPAQPGAIPFWPGMGVSLPLLGWFGPSGANVAVFGGMPSISFSPSSFGAGIPFGAFGIGFQIGPYGTVVSSTGQGGGEAQPQPGPDDLPGA